MMAGKWQKNFTEGTSGIKVDELLQVQNFFLETSDTLELRFIDKSRREGLQAVAMCHLCEYSDSCATSAGVISAPPGPRAHCGNGGKPLQGWGDLMLQQEFGMMLDEV